MDIQLWRYLFDDDRALAAHNARRAASVWLSAQGIPDAERADIVLCVGEAAKNVANVVRTATRFTVRLSVGIGWCRWRVRDDGRVPFDWRAVVKREEAATVTLEEHGRGLLLMRGLSDSLRVYSGPHGAIVRGYRRWDV